MRRNELTFINILREILLSLESGPKDQVWLGVIARTKRSVFAQGGIDEEEAASNVVKRQKKPFFQPTNGQLFRSIISLLIFFEPNNSFLPLKSAVQVAWLSILRIKLGKDP